MNSDKSPLNAVTNDIRLDPCFAVFGMPSRESPVQALCEQLGKRLGRRPLDFHLSLTHTRLEDTGAGLADVFVRMAESVGPLTVTFTDIEQGDDYFKRLFLSTAETPALRRCYETFERGFGNEPPAHSFHGSLCYGDSVEPQQVEFVRQQLKLPITVRIERIELWSLAGYYWQWHPVASRNI